MKIAPYPTDKTHKKRQNKWDISSKEGNKQKERERKKLNK